MKKKKKNGEVRKPNGIFRNAHQKTKNNKNNKPPTQKNFKTQKKIIKETKFNKKIKHC